MKSGKIHNKYPNDYGVNPGSGKVDSSKLKLKIESLRRWVRKVKYLKKIHEEIKERRAALIKIHEEMDSVELQMQS